MRKKEKVWNERRNRERKTKFSAFLYVRGTIEESRDPGATHMRRLRKSEFEEKQKEERDEINRAREREENERERREWEREWQNNVRHFFIAKGRGRGNKCSENALIRPRAKQPT